MYICIYIYTYIHILGSPHIDLSDILHNVRNILIYLGVFYSLNDNEVFSLQNRKNEYNFF